MWENILTSEIIFFLIAAIAGIILLVIVLTTETEIDDYYFLPILGGLINFGIIGIFVYLATSDLTFTVVLAIIAWVITSSIIIYTRNIFETKPTDYKIYVGKEATVEIPFSKDQMGRISATLKSGISNEFPARAEDPNDPPYKTGDKVIIKRLDGMIAEVAKIINWELKKLKRGVN